MVKLPKDTEVVMYGDKRAPQAPARAEVIRFDQNGKPMVQQGGGVQGQQPQARPAQAARPAAPAPQPAAQPARPKAGDAKQQGRAIAQSGMTNMMSKLREAAAAKGGMISIQDIDAMQAEFAQQAKAMEAQLERAFEDFAQAREKLQWNIERNDPFYRLMVKNFSHLFKEAPSRKSVTRRMLPGFFMAIGMILGPDLVSSYRERCKGVLGRIDGFRKDFDWEEFYAEKDALTVKLDAQLVVASRFSDFERRSNWYINLVNSNLATPEANASQELAQWELTEPAFRRFLDAFLGDVRKLLSSDKGRERLSQRHGADTVADALKTLKKLITG